MKFEEIKELIKLIDDTDLSYFEIKTKEGFIKLDKSLSRNIESNKETQINNKIEEKVFIKEEVKKEVEVNNYVSNEDEKDVEYIKSPMVGTFYSSPSPDSDSFVSVGDTVSKGDVLCIVEAMKLMNEINSEFNFELLSILVKEGEMVEFGQNIFKVRKI
ncbi:MAG: acetyl-CoA carboxylase biotin carboxyl carrier protein [Peptostreptococcaceae bacterium]